MNGEKLPSENNQESSQDNPWSILENYSPTEQSSDDTENPQNESITTEYAPVEDFASKETSSDEVLSANANTQQADEFWHIPANYSQSDAIQKESEPEIERMVSPLPVINWEEFCHAPDEMKHVFVDAVREEFGPIGYNGFHGLFNSTPYWQKQRSQDLVAARKAGDLERYEKLRGQALFVEPGTQPSVKLVTDKLKALGYQWKLPPHIDKEKTNKFRKWIGQCYRVRAGEQIGPFETPENAVGATLPANDDLKSIVTDYPWHDLPPKESEPEVECMLSPLPVINWEEFSHAPEEAQRAFVDAVREEFGTVGYSGFHGLFNSMSYWKWRRERELLAARKAGDDEKYKELCSRLFIEPGIQPSIKEVTDKLKALGYQWKLPPHIDKEKTERFRKWSGQCCRVRAGEQIHPFETSGNEAGATPPADTGEQMDAAQLVLTYPWHDIPRIKSEPGVERMVSPLPVLSWDEFLQAPDETKRAFVDAVREEFGPVGYGEFQKLFNSAFYWRQRHAHDPIHAQMAGDLEKYEVLRSQPVFVEPGTQPSIETVTKEMKALGYQWKAVHPNSRQRDKFFKWRRQCYRVRAGEYIKPFEMVDPEHSE